MGRSQMRTRICCNVTPLRRCHRPRGGRLRGRRRRRYDRRGRHARRVRPTKARSVTARAASTCSPGRATPRTAPPTRQSTGSPRSRRRPAARSTSRSSPPPTRPSSCSSTGEYDVVSASGDASLRLSTASGAAGQPRPRPNYADIIDGAQGQAVEHRRRRSTTASRTAAAPTCSCTPTADYPSRRLVGGHVGGRLAADRAR